MLWIEYMDANDLGVTFLKEAIAEIASIVSPCSVGIFDMGPNAIGLVFVDGAVYCFKSNLSEMEIPGATTLLSISKDTPAESTSTSPSPCDLLCRDVSCSPQVISDSPGSTPSRARQTQGGSLNNTYT